jgi:hypothetical protein
MMRMIRDEDNELAGESTSQANNNEYLQKTESFSQRMRSTHQPKHLIEKSNASDESQPAH